LREEIAQCRRHGQMHDACMVRYVDLVVRRLGNPKQRAKSLGNYVGERLGKLTAGRSVSPRFVLTPYRLRNRR
jgi:hypothetical protein